jgi:hypothetical protein
MRAKRVMSANLTRTKTEGNRYRVDALRQIEPCLGHAGDAGTHLWLNVVRGFGGVKRCPLRVKENWRK